MTTNSAKGATVSTASPGTVEPDTILPAPILPEVMGVATVASLLGVSKQTVVSWIRKGHLHATKKTPKSPYKITKEDLKKYYSASGR